MTVDLITNRWLPGRRASGARAWFAPFELGSDFADPIVALEFPRPDWNAAVTEMLIGLLSAAIPPAGTDAWAAHWLAPPEPDVLAAALRPLEAWLRLDGEGMRAFQDPTDLADVKEILGVEALLLDEPPDDNRDLFTKRGTLSALGAPFAAAAIITLQTYAPGGGRGHMANPRKKGPMSLLAATHRLDGERRQITTLWDLLWPNVMERPKAWAGHRDLSSVLAEVGSKAFPWGELPRSSDGVPVVDDDLPGFSRYFAQPRRIRLLWADGSTACTFGGTEGPVCTGFRMKAYGHQYSTWRHPLSTYVDVADKKSKEIVKRSVAVPQTQSYEHWPVAWGYGENLERPGALGLWRERLAALEDARAPIDPQVARQQAIVAWGPRAHPKLEMKVLAWAEERIPLYDVPDAVADDFRAMITRLVAGTSAAADKLVYAIRFAKHAKRKREGGLELRRDDLSKLRKSNAHVDCGSGLWRHTETAFRNELDALRALPTDPQTVIRTRFAQVLRGQAIGLFDDVCNLDMLTDQDVQRIMIARTILVAGLSNYGDLGEALNIVPAKDPEAKTKPKRSKSTATQEAAR